MSTANSSSTPALDPSPTWPLTTIFTPPPSCLPGSVSWSTCTGWQLSNSKMWACGPSTKAEDCLPTSFYSNSQTPTFSPGVCPHGYTVATSSISGVAALSSVPASEIRTVELCCPSGLDYRPSIYAGIYNQGICYTTLTVVGSAVSAAGSSSYYGPSGIGTITTDIYNLPQHTSPQTVVLGYQSPLTVAWASENLATFTPASAPLVVAASTTGSSISSSSASTGQAESSSLSTGAKAGIGIGVALVAILAIAGVVVLVLRRKSRSKQVEPETSSKEAFELENSGNEYSDLGDGRKEYSELESKRKVGELQAEERYELPADFEGYEFEGSGGSQKPVHVEDR